MKGFTIPLPLYGERRRGRRSEGGRQRVPKGGKGVDIKGVS